MKNGKDWRKILAETKVKNGNQGKKFCLPGGAELVFSRGGLTKLLSSRRHMDQLGMLSFQGFWKP